MSDVNIIIRNPLDILKEAKSKKKGKKRKKNRSERHGLKITEAEHIVRGTLRCDTRVPIKLPTNYRIFLEEIIDNIVKITYKDNLIRWETMDYVILLLEELYGTRDELTQEKLDFSNDRIWRIIREKTKEPVIEVC